MQYSILPESFSKNVGFGTQMCSTVRRQFLQKRRACCSTIMEIVLPVIIILLLGLISTQSNIQIIKEKQFVEDSTLPKFAKNISSAVCYNSSNQNPNPFSNLIDDCSSYNVVMCADTDVILPVPGICVISESKIKTITTNFQYGGLKLPILDFDTMILLQCAAKIVYKYYSSFSLDYISSLLISGKIFFIPENQDTRDIVTFFNKTYLLFNSVFGGYYDTQGDFDAYVKSKNGEGKTWVSIELKEINKNKINFVISPNKSAVTLTQDIRDYFANGLGGQNYLFFLSSGFLSVQQSVYGYYNSYVLGTNTSKLYNLPIIPMGYKSYKSSAFILIAQTLCPLLVVLAFLYFVSQLSKNLVEEKEKRLREGTMIMGLGKGAFFCSWLFTYYIIAFIITLLCALISSFLITKKTPFLVIWILFFLFGFSTVNFTVLLSCFFNNSKITAFIVPIIYFIVSIPSFALPRTTPDWVYSLFAFLFCPVSFSIGYRLIFQHELIDGIGFNLLFNPIEKPMSMVLVYAFLIISYFLYLILFLYFDMVIPKEWGTSYHPLFFLTCCRRKKYDVLDENTQFNDKKDLSTIQNYPLPSSEATVRIMNLLKEFPSRDGSSKKFVAVNNINLLLFPDSVSVFLGHNGAGKTTLINMLTGMIDRTNGDAMIYGKLVSQDLADIRHMTGYCPQHNILWDNLTCREHLCYFARLKGVPSSQVQDEAKKYLHCVQLDDKADVFSSKLSGGQKRKLSVAIAFIGGSRLVLLDEPTAGMDVAARRGIWDLIREMSPGRTILLTTHFMDEADLLGNRIAIISKGTLHSYGTPLFLKNKLGAGYVLRISSSSEIKDALPFLHLVHSIIPDAEIKEVKGQEAAIVLPKEDVQRFSSVIRRFEDPSVAQQYGITGISMSVTTLEDVFLRIAEEEEKKGTNEVSRKGESQVDIHQMELKNAFAVIGRRFQSGTTNPNMSRQFKGLLIKRLNHGRRDYKALCLQILCPIILIILAMLIAYISTSKDVDVTVTNDMYSPAKQMTTLNLCGSIKKYFELTFSRVDETKESNFVNFSNYLLRNLDRHGDYEQTMAFACEGNSSSLIFVNSTYPYSAPLAINEYYLANLRMAASKNDIEYIMGIHSQPTTNSQKKAQDSTTSLLICLVILIPLSLIPSIYVFYIVKERATKAKHLQFVSGVNLVIYWISNYVFDFLSFLITLIIAIIIFACFNRKEYIGSPEAGGCTFLILLLYGTSGISAAYLMSFLFDNPSLGQNVTMITNFLSGFIFVIIIFILKNIFPDKTFVKIILYIIRLIPSYCVGEGILNMALEYSIREQGLVRNYFSMEVAGYDLLYMGLESVFFLMLTIIIDLPFWKQKIQQMSFKSNTEPPFISNEDSDVIAERLRVENASGNAGVITVKKLRKVYGQGIGQPEKVAVQNISFGVLPREVFGFLGTNGAGKTTTMSILTGEILPTMGSATIGGYDIIKELCKARKVVGYCPQFDALLDLLTPPEHLYLYAAIRGIPSSETDALVDALITCCALEPFRKVQSKDLSGGNKRKLSTAISFTGCPKVVLLDEPSAGMDPQARRQLWDVIQYAAKYCSVVLTTHHLEEVDVLAHRVAIMDRGLIRCMGSLEHLKHKFGDGYELAVQVRSSDEIDVATAQRCIHSVLPSAVLVEERQQRLLYSVPFASTKLSDLFDTIQKITKDLTSAITDYTVQHSSLEQVFMRISRGDIISDVTSQLIFDSVINKNSPILKKSSMDSFEKELL